MHAFAFQMSLNQKDQEVEFLRSMLGRLSERLENLEKTVDMKLGNLETLPDIRSVHKNGNKLLLFHP